MWFQHHCNVCIALFRECCQPDKSIVATKQNKRISKACKGWMIYILCFSTNASDGVVRWVHGLSPASEFFPKIQRFQKTADGWLEDSAQQLRPSDDYACKIRVWPGTNIHEWMIIYTYDPSARLQPADFERHNLDSRRRIMEEKSWRRNHGGEIMEEKAWRRNHGG